MLDTIAGVTEAQHDWVVALGGPDPRKFPATRAPAVAQEAAPGGAPQTGAQQAAAPGAPPPAAATAPAAGQPAAPAPPKTPDELRADFDRRFKASKALYDKFGPAADDLLKPEDRLTPAELKVGSVTVETADSTKVDAKGVTTKTTTTTSQAKLGPDGKPIELTHEQSTTNNYGLLNASTTTGSTVTRTADGQSDSITRQTTTGVDLLKGEASHTTSHATETKAATPDASGKTEDKTTVTAGMSGVNRTVDHAQQTGDHLDSSTSTVGLQRSDGMLGVGGSKTKTSGTMEGPPDKQKMQSGTETNIAGNAGLVSDDKGTGIGFGGSGSGKVVEGPASITDTISAGGRCQSLVKEVTPATVPATFKITTTISFNVAIGTSSSIEAAPNAKPKEDGRGLSDGKASVSGGVSASYAKSASFTHTLEAAAAKKYLDDIAANGRGGSFPEHQILATGMSDGWEAAARLYQTMTGSAAQAKTMKQGDEIETSTQTGAGAKLGGSGGETREGGGTVAVDLSASKTHKVTLNRKALPDGTIQVTASIDDATDVAGGVGVNVGMAGGKAGVSHGTGQGHSVAFVLDPKSPDFDKVFKEIEGASSAAELDRIAAQHHNLVGSTTDRTSQSDGENAGLSVGLVGANIGGKGQFNDETTRDRDGHEIGSKTSGTNQGGGAINVGDVSIGDTVTTGFAGEVKDGKATADISATTTSTSFDKTMQKLGAVGSDPLGAIMHPGKLVGDQVDTDGISIENTEILAYVNAACDAAAWNKKIVGGRHDDWVACGKAIRAAVSQDKDGKQVINLHAVEAALAQWQKADYSGNTDALTDIIRPLHGVPAGHARSFPDGTESMAADWDALMKGDPLTDANAKAKAGQIAEAVATAKAVRDQVQSLSNRINTASKKWEDAGLTMQHDEMLGFVNDRLAEIDGRIRDMTKLLPPPPAVAGQSPADAAAQAKQAEAKRHTDETKVDLNTYNDYVAQMHNWGEDIPKRLDTIEADLKGGGSVVDALKPLRQVEEQLSKWDDAFAKASKLFATLKATLALDPARLEQVRPASTRQRWVAVNRLTKMAGMPGAGTGSFPPGTEKMQTDWSALMESDPLAAATEQANEGHIVEALAAMRAVRQQVQSLSNRINTASQAWADAGMQSKQADMLGRITDRLAAIDGRIRELAKQVPPPPAQAAAQPAKPGDPTPPPADPAAEAKLAEARQRAEDAKADLETYNNYIEQMHRWSDSVFQRLGEVESKIKGFSLFGNKAADVQVPMVEIDQQIGTWDQTYWKAYKLYEKWSPFLNLDKSRIEKLNTAGARGRYNEVSKMASSS